MVARVKGISLAELGLVPRKERDIYILTCTLIRSSNCLYHHCNLSFTSPAPKPLATHSVLAVIPLITDPNHLVTHMSYHDLSDKSNHHTTALDNHLTNTPQREIISPLFLRLQRLSHHQTTLTPLRYHKTVTASPTYLIPICPMVKVIIYPYFSTAFLSSSPFEKPLYGSHLYITLAIITYCLFPLL